MRDFEEDFDFDSDYFGNDCQAVRTREMRIDVYPTVTADKTEHSDDAERKTRIAAHTKRIQRELQELGIVKGSRE